MTERRRYPRISAKISAKVTVINGNKLKVMLCDLSSSGLKIECDYLDRELISPKGQWTVDGHPREVSIQADLPIEPSKTIPMGACCTLVFSRRIAKDIFHVGLSFKHIDEQSFFHLGEFIEARLKNSTQTASPELALLD